MRALLLLFAPMLVSIAPRPAPTLPPSVPPACQTPAPTTSGSPLGTPAPAGGGNLMQPRFGGGLGFFEVDGAAPGPRAGRTAPIELELTGPSRVSPTDALGLRLTAHNRSGQPVVMMRALDGSLEHWRDPHYDLYLRDEASGQVYRWDFHGGRCGNVNPITDEDYLTFAPGGHDDQVAGPWASHLAQARVGAPGRYAAWVVYRWCGHDGSGLPLGTDVRRQVTPGVFASNPISIEVR